MDVDNESVATTTTTTTTAKKNKVENNFVSIVRPYSKLKIIPCDEDTERQNVIQMLKLKKGSIYAGSFVAWLAGYISDMSNNINVYTPINHNDNDDHLPVGYLSDSSSSNSDDDSDQNNDDMPPIKRLKPMDNNIFNSFGPKCYKRIQKQGVFVNVQIQYYSNNFRVKLFIENLLSTFDQNICKFALFYNKKHNCWCFAHLTYDTAILSSSSLERLKKYNARYKASKNRLEYTKLLEDQQKFETCKKNNKRHTEKLDLCQRITEEKFRKTHRCEIYKIVDDEFEFEKLKPICNFASIMCNLLSEMP